jgi:hypothetical protein
LLIEVRPEPGDRRTGTDRHQVGTCLALCLVLLGAPMPPANTPNSPRLGASVQFAAESRPPKEQQSGQDLDSDESWPSSPHQRSLGTGQRRAVGVTSPPSGYDAKRLNRLWGRFRGAKSDTRAEKEKHHK